MSKIKKFFSFLFFSFSFFSLLIADNKGEIIRSASEIDYPPFCHLDERGSPTGFSVELLTEALKRMDKKVNFKVGIWADVKKMLEIGEVDVLPLVGRTPEREEIFDFTFPYMTLYGAIVVRADNNDIHSIDDIEGKTIAVMKADNAEEYLIRKNYKINLLSLPTFKDALIALSEGNADAVVIQRLVALRLLSEMSDYNLNLKVLNTPIKDFFQAFCFAVKEGNGKLLSELNEGLSILFADGTYNNLYTKWFARYELPTRTIIIGGDQNFPPYEFINEKGIAEGFNVELMKKIAEQKGLDIKFHLDKWTNTLEGLKVGEIDLIQGIFYSRQRAEYFDFSRPYLTFNYVAVTRNSFKEKLKSLSQLKGLQIVVEDDDIAEEYCRNEGLSENLHFADNMRDALLQLSKGDYDCAIVPITTATYIIEKEKIKNLKINNNALFTLDYCCAVKKGNKALLAEFNDGLKILEENGDLFRLQKKWFVKNLFLENLKAFIIILLVLSFALLLAFIWIKALRSTVAKKLTEIASLERRYKEIFEASRDGMVITDENGKIIDANESYCNMLGYSLDEIRKFENFYEITPEKWHKWEREEIWNKRLLQYGSSGLYEKEYIRKNGEIFPVELNLGVVRDNKTKKILYVWGVVRDITQRKNYERELQEKLLKEEVNAKISLLSINSTTLSEFINKSFDLLGQKLDFFRIYLLELSEKDKQILNTHQWCPHEIFPQSNKVQLFKFNLDDPFFSGVEEKDLLVIEDISKVNSEVIRKTFEELNIKSLLLVKISIYNKFYGFIAFCESRYQRKWLGNEKDLILSVSKIFSIAFEKFRALEEEHLLSVAIENSAEAVVITDSSGVIRYVNRAFENMTGYTIHEMMGKKINILKSGKQDKKFYENLWENLNNKKNWQGQFINKRKDGTEYYAEAFISPIIDDEGEITNYVAIERDVSERLRLESQLRAAQKLEALGRIAGGVAHDFNNMLSVIIGFAELAREKLGENPVVKDIDEIIKTGKKSAELTNQLLSFARRDISKPELVKLNEFINGNLNMLSKVFPKNVSFSFRASEKELSIKIDPSQLTQILMNICINARDAIDKKERGEVKIIVAPFDPVKDSHKNMPMIDEEVLYARISISDNGCGMTPEILDNIFEPFFTTKPKGYGTGLGLSTVYGIIKQNNGFITVDTAVGEGTTFNIYLPIVQEGVDSNFVSFSDLEMPMAKSTTKRKTILIVEDDPSILIICKNILEKEGYKIVSSTKPQEAIRLVDIEGNVDLLLTDVVMPDMNGKELAEKVIKKFPACKVLYMSGYTSDVILTKGIVEEETISQPYMAALMTELIYKDPPAKVLDVGTGSGYQTAILAYLGYDVISIEKIEEVAKFAEENLKDLPYTQKIRIIIGDGSIGFSDEAPYDAIIVSGACPKIPPPLVEQLAPEGKLCIPCGPLYVQKLLVAKKDKSGKNISVEETIDCRFVPIIGKNAFKSVE